MAERDLDLALNIKKEDAQSAGRRVGAVVRKTEQDLLASSQAAEHAKVEAAKKAGTSVLRRRRRRSTPRTASVGMPRTRKSSVAPSSYPRQRPRPPSC